MHWVSIYMSHTALPCVICLLPGTWQQLLMRQVDLQMDKGREERAVY